MVYISHPTEYGALYSKAELTALHGVCRDFGIPLYMDGARLAYALACEENDVTLPDIAALCDVFYIGGTKCGALMGEAVVAADPDRLPRFFTIMKQHGALLAKGRLLGIQFDTLFTDGLYLRIGRPALEAADAVRRLCAEAGYPPVFDTPTNQVFIRVDNAVMERLAEKAAFSFWEKYDESSTIIRFATSWATPMAKVERLKEVMEGFRR